MRLFFSYFSAKFTSYIGNISFNIILMQQCSGLQQCAMVCVENFHTIQKVFFLSKSLKTIIDTNS